MVISTNDIRKNYVMGRLTLNVLKGISLQVANGEYLSIIGKSGSGKTTLLNILGCLDSPTSGKYILSGENISTLTKNRLAAIRKKKIGFVFQNFNLLPNLTVYENVELPLIYLGLSRGQRKKRVQHTLRKFSLEQRSRHLPTEISGGQKQRTAIARAMIKKPDLLLADEPTGNLDSNTSREILNMLGQLNNEGTTILLVTHDMAIAKETSRIIEICDGYKK